MPRLSLSLVYVHKIYFHPSLHHRPKCCMGSVKLSQVIPSFSLLKPFFTCCMLHLIQQNTRSHKPHKVKQKSIFLGCKALKPDEWVSKMCNAQDHLSASRWWSSQWLLTLWPHSTTGDLQGDHRLRFHSPLALNEVVLLQGANQSPEPNLISAQSNLAVDRVCWYRKHFHTRGGWAARSFRLWMGNTFWWEWISLVK